MKSFILYFELKRSSTNLLRAL